MNFNQTNLGKWVCLFFYPLDFTFVCPTELIAFSDMTAEFAANNCQVVACSVDSHFSHKAWDEMPRKVILASCNLTLVSNLGRRSRWRQLPNLGRFLQANRHWLRCFDWCRWWNRPPWPFLDWPKRYCPSLRRQRFASWPFPRGGTPNPPGLPVCRGARRGLPSQLEARRSYHQPSPGICLLWIRQRVNVLKLCRNSKIPDPLLIY